MTDIVISPSELDVMRQCPLRHSLLYGERWTKAVTDDSALGFGTLWHAVLEAHYRAIQTHQRTHSRASGDWRKFDHAAAEAFARERANLVIAAVPDPEVQVKLNWMYQGHVAHWGVDPQWQIMAVEHPCEVALPAPGGVETDFTFRIKMKMDLVVKWEGRIWVVDNKSAKNLPANLELDLDDQFGLYIWGLRQLGFKVFGALHNCARKTQLVADADGSKPTPLEQRFRRTPLTRGDHELTTIATEAWQVAHERYRGLREVTEMRRLGIDVEAPRHPSPMTCSWKCDWVHDCINGRKGADLRDSIKRKGFRQDRSRH